MVEFEGVGSGGGGGSGAVQTGTGHTGGNGADGGCRGGFRVAVPAGVTALYVTVGAPGIGGAAVGTTAADGLWGADGAAVTVQATNSGGATLFNCPGGFGGRPGTRATATNPANTPTPNTKVGLDAGGTGGLSSTTAPVAGGSTYLAGAGGDCGAAINASNVVQSNGGRGLAIWGGGQLNTAAPAGEPLGGSGGQGGSTAGAAGQVGYDCGAGGGGGAAALAGNLSGAGAGGGKGCVRMTFTN
jgi:hypothetical protein